MLAVRTGLSGVEDTAEFAASTRMFERIDRGAYSALECWDVTLAPLN